MFPIPWNFPFRKKDGDITTIGEMVDGGGGGGGSELPPHTIADAGKVLMVGENNTLVWSTITGVNTFATASPQNITTNPTITAKGGE